MHIAPFRIVAEGDQHDEVVAIHGWLTEPAVGELANVVARRGFCVRIDLSHLVGADQAGLVALRRLREEGVPLTDSSPLFDLLLDGMRAGPGPAPTAGRLRGVLTDEEVTTIRRKLAAGWRGPVPLRWLEELLADREELLDRLRVLEAARRGHRQLQQR